MLYLIKFKNWFIDGSIMQRKISLTCRNTFQVTPLEAIQSDEYRKQYARAIVAITVTFDCFHKHAMWH